MILVLVVATCSSNEGTCPVSQRADGYLDAEGSHFVKIEMQVYTVLLSSCTVTARTTMLSGLMTIVLGRKLTAKCHKKVRSCPNQIDIDVVARICAE